MNHVDREYTAFLDKVRDRARKSNRWLDRNRWVEPIVLTRQKTYDRETERLRSLMSNNERKAS